MATRRFDPRAFSVKSAKPLPVIFLLDESGSMNEVITRDYQRTGETFMQDGQLWERVVGGRTKIQVLNEVLRKMLTEIGKMEVLGKKFLVSVITFGDAARRVREPDSATRISSQWQDLDAPGNRTCLGEALTLAKNGIEDKTLAPSGCWRPVVILITDGVPEKGWEMPLSALMDEGRSRNADRMVLGIGSELDESVLEAYAHGTAHPVFHAKDAEQIHTFFEYVTQTTVARSVSQNPNENPGEAEMRLARVQLKDPGATASGPAAPPPVDDHDFL